VLSGESGAGKTTLLALALRFCDPTRGRILAGGVDLRELDPDAWREQIAWLPQRSHLIAGTVATALRVAAPDADEPLLWAALEAAGAADLVRALPGGLETVVGEGGTTFSAGEVRRLALARALVRRAPLLLLDEPTAHLDAATAASIRNSLGAIGGAHTILVATHDPELVAMATRVVRLPDGQTVEKDDR
jgi:ABC-type multidrug transport system fused ATPase/permease subunit